MSDNPFDDDVSSSLADLPEASDKDTGLTLSKEQTDFIDSNWSKLDLMEMVRHIFKDDNLKGTSREGRLVRQYLIDKKYEYQTSAYTKKSSVILNDEQKEFAIKYAKEMKPYEIARVIFKNDKITPTSKESHAVQEHIKSISLNLIEKDDEFTDEEYAPPKNVKKLIEKINSSTLQNFEESKLNVKAKKCVDKALEFMNAPRFVQTVNNLKNLSERIIFESEYIRAVWDKPDLTSDEINLYISLVNEYVIQNRLHRITTKLNMILESVTEDKDGKISISLSDAIKGKSEELHQSLHRQTQFVKDLSGRRSDRQKLQTARAKSLVSLVEAFRDEAERKNTIRLAELRKQAVKDETERLETMDEWEVRIFGISKEEILE